MSEALRRQDWASVVIEFLLVALGVLLAFQINAWAAEREARTARKAAIERLLQEAEETVAYLRGGVDRNAAQIGDLAYTLERIQQGTAETADKPRMTTALLRVLNAAAPSPPSSVYDDLVASGEFGKVGDARLRAAIARYRATLAFQGRAIDYLRQRMPDFQKYDSLRYVFAPSDGHLVRLDVDFASLMRDSDLQEELALISDHRLQGVQIAQRTTKDAETMCLELGRVVGRPCDLDRPVPTFS